jgi:hypothetical protein
MPKARTAKYFNHRCIGGHLTGEESFLRDTTSLPNEKIINCSSWKFLKIYQGLPSLGQYQEATGLKARGKLGLSGKNRATLVEGARCRVSGFRNSWTTYTAEH